MSRYILLLVITVFLFKLALCRHSSGNKWTNIPSPTKAPTIPSPTVAPTRYIQIGDNCYCPTTDASSPTTSKKKNSSSKSKKKKSSTKKKKSSTKKKKSKKKSDSSEGYGDCDCDKRYGLVEIRMRSDIQGSIKLQIFYDGIYGDMICEFTDVEEGDEFICNIDDYGSSSVTRFRTNTYFLIYNSTDSRQCVGKFHTSCSKDIVGTYSTDYYNFCSSQTLCSQILCTGWKDGNPSDNNTCDDGLELCSCSDSSSPTVEPAVVPVTPPTSPPTGDPFIPPTSAPTGEPAVSPTSFPTSEPTLDCTSIAVDGCHNYQNDCCVREEVDTFPVQYACHSAVDDDVNNNIFTECVSCAELYDYNCDEWSHCCLDTIAGECNDC